MTRITEQPLNGIAIYNPALLSKDELIEQFVARRALLDRLVDDLVSVGAGQHHLICGQRGMGKTTLLRRLSYAIEDHPQLSSRWLPLSFPEEQYDVARLSDLYTNCIDALCDYLERHGHDQRVEQLDAQVDRLPREDSARTEAALSLLLSEAGARQKGLVLLIDNIDLVFKRLNTQEEWALREVLSKQEKLLIVGASATMLEAKFQYDAPFYDFFLTHELYGLSVEETRQVMLRLAEAGQTPHVKDIVKNQPERLRTIQVLSGGNPRTTALLYNVLASDRVGSVRTDLELLLDQCTALYKARFEELPQQAQQIVHALAVAWDPCLANDIALSTRLDVKTVSSQLNRLVKQGLVQKVRYPPSTKHGFQIAERFFNIWYLMRTSRRVRRRLLWLVKFLKMVFEPKRIEGEARAYLRAREAAAASMGQKHTELGLALAQVVEQTPLRDALNHEALHSIITNRRLWSRVRGLFDLASEDADLEPLVTRHEKLAAVKACIQAAEVTEPGWDPDRFEALLLGTPGPSTAAKLGLAEAILADPERYLDIAITTLQLWHNGLTAFLGSHTTSNNLCQAFQVGHMVDLDDLDGARSAAEAYEDPELVRLARLAQRPMPAELMTVLEGTSVPGLLVISGIVQMVTHKDPAMACEPLQRALAIEPSFWLARLCAGLFYFQSGAAQDICSQLMPTEATSRFGRSVLCITRIVALERAGEHAAAKQERIHLAELCEESLWADIARLICDCAPFIDKDDASSEAQIERILIERVPDIRAAIDWRSIVDTILSACGYVILCMCNRHLEKRDNQYLAIFKLRNLVGQVPTALEQLDAELERHPELREILGCSFAELAANIEHELVSFDERYNPAPKTAHDWIQRAWMRHEPCAEIGLAESTYREALALEPENAGFRRCLGSLLQTFEDRHEEVLQLYEEGLALAPDSGTLWHGKFELYKQREQYELALGALDRALSQIDDDDDDLLQDKATLLADDLNRYEEALGVYEQLIAKKPDEVEYWFAKYDLLLDHLQRPVDALACIEQVLTRDESNADAWFYLGQMEAFYTDDGREHALSSLRAALTHDEEHVDAWTLLAYLLASEPDEFGEAEKACQRALELAPDTMGAWQTLAQVRLQRGSIDQETEDAARQVVALAPEWPDAHLTLAAVLMARGSWLEALAMAKRTLQSTDEPETNWPLIELLSRQAARASRARELAEMLADVGLAGEWQPLHEALLASAEGSNERLQRIAPEIRMPAQELLDYLNAE